MLLLTFDTKEECDKFTVLYERYRKTVLYTISLYITDPFQKEDLLQEIFIIIGKNLQKVDMSDDRKSRNYIITIARNYCRSYLRRQSRIEEDFFEDIDRTQVIQDDILDTVIDKERLEHLVREIGKLEEHYKIVMELKYITEFSDEEIADFLHIKKKTVQMRLYRAKTMLRRKEGCGESGRYGLGTV